MLSLYLGRMTLEHGINCGKHIKLYICKNSL